MGWMATWVYLLWNSSSKCILTIFALPWIYMSDMDWIVFLQNSFVGTLNPGVIMYRGGYWGGNWVYLSSWGLCPQNGISTLIRREDRELTVALHHATRRWPSSIQGKSFLCNREQPGTLRIPASKTMRKINVWEFPSWRSG